MPIDLSTQRGLSPKEAAIYFPSYKDGKPCHASKVVRLITKGTRQPGGKTDRLEALRIGNQWVTTLEAIQEYGERVAAARLAQYSQIAPRTTPARREALGQVARKLDAAGI